MLCANIFIGKPRDAPSAFFRGRSRARIVFQFPTREVALVLQADRAIIEDMHVVVSFWIFATPPRRQCLRTGADCSLFHGVITLIGLRSRASICGIRRTNLDNVHARLFSSTAARNVRFIVEDLLKLYRWIAWKLQLTDGMAEPELSLDYDILSFVW